MANKPFQLLNPDGSPIEAAGVMPAEQGQPNVRQQQARSMPQIAIAAAARAKADGDMEAYQALMEEAQMDYRAETQNAAVEGQGGLRNFAAGVGQGMTNVGRHAANLLTTRQSGRGAAPGAGAPAAGMTDERLAQAAELDAPLLNDAAGGAGSFVGETAALAPVGGPVSGTMARVGGAGVARQLAKPVVRGMAEGAAQGALMADPGAKGQGALTGGIAGAVLPVGMAAGRTAVRGIERTPEAQALLDRGVDLTPGQMNPRGMYNQLEEGTESAPFTGTFIKGARNNARESFNQAAVREGAAPGATLNTDNPRAMLDAAYNSFQPLYDQAKGFPIVGIQGKPVIMNAGANTPLAQVFTQIVRSGGTTNNVRNKVHKFLENEFSADLSTSDAMLKMRSNIRERIRNAKQSTGDKNENADVAKMLERAEQAVTQALDSQLPPQAMQVVRAADQQYSQYKILEDALYRAKDAPDGFTPTQLSMAARDSSTNAGAYARGQRSPVGEIARQGVATMEQQTPPTGARAAQLALAVPTAGASYALPAIFSGTKAGRRFAAGSTKAQRGMQAMADAILPNVNPDVRRAIRAEMQAAAIAASVQNSQVRE